MDFFDIAIVGGGPGGATLANIFASRGVKVALIERQKDFSRSLGEKLLCLAARKFWIKLVLI